MTNNLDYKFPVSKKDYSKIEKKGNICITVFCYENDLVYLVYIWKPKFEDCMDLLLLNDENKPHYVYIKDFNRFISIRQNIKIKKTFADTVYNVLVVKGFWWNIKRNV